jgi:beta-1,2-mannobiose phosphorylase / 1,2-beta-oligomannan phosphorylase
MNLILGINWLALAFSCFVAGCLIGALCSPPVRKTLREIVTKLGRRDLALARISANPIIKPGSHPWEAEAVFNPAALALGGRTHLIYRAIGTDGVSRLGYASSANSIVFDERLPYPIYVSQDQRQNFTGTRRYAPTLYPSGGSWGGCEDPRMVTIDGRVYVTFNAFDNWDIRVAFISITEQDFLAKRWYRWSTPKLLSRIGERHKNWVLFPEKIHGKFAILHNLHCDVPDVVRVEYIDDLDSYDPSTSTFESPDPHVMPDRRCAWHDRMRSAGPPPLRTNAGWLVFYHATESREWQRYKLGAMLLSFDDPTQVLHRSAHPVLEPDAWYENDGKPGIVYACGSVIRDGMLYVYYGGADKVVCVAVAPLLQFITSLTTGGHAMLASENLQIS